MNKYQRPDTLNQAREFLGTVILHRWGILLVTVLLSAISIVVIALLPDSYLASTTVLFDPQKLPEKYVAPTVTADPSQRLNTLTQEVLSAGRLQQISQQLQLNPESHLSPQEVVEQMRKAITIEMKPNADRDMTSFVISYTGHDPQLAAAVANRLAQSFIDWDLANREQLAVSTNEFMTAQLQDAKQKLEGEEARMDDYKKKHSGALPEQLQSNMQALSTLHSALQANSEALDRLGQEETMLTSVPQASHTVVGPPSDRDRLETEQRTLQAQLSQLRSEYTEQYPDVVAAKERLDVVTKQLSNMDPGPPSIAVSTAEVRLQIIKRETERLQTEQRSLMQRINQYQAQIDATPLRGQEIESLSRDYNTARDQYETMLDKKFQSEMAMELERQQKTSRFTVDPAQVPDKPTKPNRLLLMAVALPFCLIIPAGITVAGAELRGTVNSERALRSLLPDTARVVANIPVIETAIGVRSRRRMAMLSILGSLFCCLAVAAFFLEGGAAHVHRNHAHQFVPSNPTAKLSKQ
jgi:polysaccharide biosynthesis transport protein